MTTKKRSWETPTAFLSKRAKDGKKYVDYRKKFKYSVSDGSIVAYYNGADYTFTWEQGRPYILRYTPQIVAGTAKIEYIATWFDDPHDSEMISFGYHLWDKR